MNTVRRKRALRYAAAVTVLCAGVVLAAYLQPGGAGHPPTISLVGTGIAATAAGGDSANAAAGHSGFGISGRVAGLYPGASLPLTLRIDNPNSFKIDVVSITTSIGDASAACLAANLTVSQFTGDILVPAHGSASEAVVAMLQHSAPNACQGAVFPLTYNATAKKP